jgi:hypothetical protein
MGKSSSPPPSSAAAPSSSLAALLRDFRPEKRAAKVLDDYTRLFINIGTSRNEIIARSRQLKNIISPLLSRAAASLNDISNNLAPIPSVKYLHIRNERKRVREVVDESNSRMSPELQLVSNYVLQEERKMKGVTNSITPPKKRTKTKTNENITPPSNGVQYRKSEVVNAIQLSTFSKEQRMCLQSSFLPPSLQLLSAEQMRSIDRTTAKQ